MASTDDTGKVTSILRHRWALLALVLLLGVGVTGSALALRGHAARAQATRTAAHTEAAVAPSAALPARHPRAVEPQAGVEPASGDPAQNAPESEPALPPEKLPQPVSDAEIRRELKQSGLVAGSRGSLTPDGLAVAPFDAPSSVQQVIQAGDRIAKLPYRFGGGHATFVDTAYDCSGSVSYALAAAGLVGSPMDSTALSRWGDAGPGHWITVYANAGHAWMTVAGVRFDTSGHGVGGSRWTGASRSTAGFVQRHPPGL
jgi:cell wall-associated NlpC family hydrolase